MLLLCSLSSTQRYRAGYRFFPLSDFWAQQLCLQSCTGSWLAAVPLCFLCRPRCVKTSPKGQGGGGEQREKAEGLWNTGDRNRSGVLVTSTKAAGQLCKHTAAGSRGARAGRCRLHDLGPGPSAGRGTNRPVWLPSGSRGHRAELRHRSQPHAVLHILLGDPGTSHRDVSRPRSPPGWLSLGGHPEEPCPAAAVPGPDGTARSCLAKDYEVMLDPGSVFRAEERGLHQPEPKPRPRKSPLSWQEPAISWLPGGSRELQKIPSACLDCIKGIYFDCPLAITFIVCLCFIAAQVYLQN